MEEVGLSIYQNTWYNFPTKLMKNLIFVIMRREYVCCQFCGKLVDLHEHFKSLYFVSVCTSRNGGNIKYNIYKSEYRKNIAINFFSNIVYKIIFRGIISRKDKKKEN